MQQAKQNPFIFYLSMLLYMLLALLVRVIAFAPLYVLFAEGTESLRCVALLCPVLLLFWVLPMRYSFADALVQSPGERSFSLKKAFGLSRYGEKLLESWLHAVNVLKWGVPMALLLGYFYRCYNEVDIVTLTKSIGSLGKAATDVWCAVANVFLRLFGAEPLVSLGGLLQGVYVIGGSVLLCVLLWVYGAVRNSSTRYIWVLATRADRSPRTETRRRLRTRRWQQFGIGLCNLLLWVPFLAVVPGICKNVLGGAADKLMLAVMQQSMPEIALSGAVLPLTLAFVFLYLPLLPLRRVLTASFATRTRRAVMPQLPTDGENAQADAVEQ